MKDEQLLKEEGNELFRKGEYDEALCRYTKALDLADKDSDKAVFYRNRAACYLKLGKHDEVVKDATAALEVDPADTKSLFRRCQAYEKLGKINEAYKDGQKLLHIEPKNTAIQPIMRKLNEQVQVKVKEQQSTDSKVTQMFNLAMADDDKEKKKQAANNLIVLAREEAGAEKIYRNNGIPNLVQLLDGKDVDLRLAAARALACIAKNSKIRATCVYETVTLQRIIHLMSLNEEEISTAAGHLLQNIIIWVANVENLRNEKQRYEDNRKKKVGCKDRPYGFLSDRIDKGVYTIIDEIFTALFGMLKVAKVSAYGRDNAMEIITKLSLRKDGVGWAKQTIAHKGINGLLEVAGTIAEHDTLPITANSRQHASVALAKIYDDLHSDTERQQYRDLVDEYFTEMFGDNIAESKIEAIMALSALLQGPFDVGNGILGREGIVEIILAMLDSMNPIHVKVAVEALVYAASKKDKCSSLLKDGTPILKKLYQTSTNDGVRVRALVGLCKLGSAGGADPSAKAMADGSVLTLSKACRKFLTNPTKDVDLRRWAAEGLAFLTLDADVKEDLINDKEALQSLIDLPKRSEMAALFPVAQVFVNCTNSYDDPKPDKEMVELAKFAKQHVPETHEKDHPEYAEKRVDTLLKAGIIGGLIALAKTDSEGCKEFLSRIFLAVAMKPENRGYLVQQGGAKVLIPLALSGTEAGRAIASQALAKVAITANPEIAFPGQRCCEVVRPIIQLLHVEKTALQNFEALMALTNLASMSDTVRKRILKEKGLSQIEHYMFEEHDQLRRAATECMCNMVMCEDVLEAYKGENDKLKLLVLFCGEEDELLVRAAAGALAMLSEDEIICQKIPNSTNQWLEIFQNASVHENVEIQHRVMFILMNMMASCKEVAAKLVESSLFEVLLALSQIEEPAKAKVKDCASKALKFAAEYELIKAN